jgi:hypothetical protein
MICLILSLNIYAAEEGYTCAGKKDVLARKLDYAKKAGNQYEIAPLVTALDTIDAYCSNVDLEKKYLDNVSKKIKEVAKYQKQVDEAKINKDEKKIIKKQHKLQEKRAELDAAKAELDNFYKFLQIEQAK